MMYVCTASTLYLQTFPCKTSYPQKKFFDIYFVYSFFSRWIHLIFGTPNTWWEEIFIDAHIVLIFVHHVCNSCLSRWFVCQFHCIDWVSFNAKWTLNSALSIYKASLNATIFLFNPQSYWVYGHLSSMSCRTPSMPSYLGLPLPTLSSLRLNLRTPVCGAVHLHLATILDIEDEPSKTAS